jgi:hypothetical protein
MTSKHLKEKFRGIIAELSGHVTFLATGVICSLLTIALIVYRDSLIVKLGEFNLHLLTTMVGEAALVFVSAAIVERTLLAKYSTSVTALIRNSLDDARYASHYNVHLLPPRRSRRNAGISYLKIAQAVDNAKWVKLFCTSGVDIVQSPNAGASEITNAIMRRIEPPYSSPFDITVLSCVPGGKYAKIRQLLETPNTEGSISKDIEESVRHFKEAYGNTSTGNQVRFRWLTYDFTPQCWFLLTDKVGFAEMYHFGLNIGDHGIKGSCMGGRVPLIQCAAAATLYSALNQYFDFLVERHESPCIERQKQEYFLIKTLFDSA